MRRSFPELAGGAVAFGILALLPLVAGDYALSVGLNFLLWSALALSWALFSGLSGYVSLGHAVFYGIGAYVMVLCWQVLPLWPAVLLAGLAAGLFALCLGWPCLRVRGPYFVILTFGVAEFAKYVVVTIEAGLGRTGRLLLGTPSLATLYEAVLGLAALSFVLFFAVRRSRFGAGVLALRADESAAESIGINASASKLALFTASAVIPGMAGALIALRSTYFEPMQAFSPVTSFTIVTIGILGGSDAAPGPVLGAGFLVLISELLWARAPEIYMIVLGLLLVGFVLFVPEGIYGRLQGLARSGGR
jgi:branched-chain amino acid transport system permease protein